MWLTRFLENRITFGQLTIIDAADRRQQLGHARRPEEPRSVVRIHDRRTRRQLVLDPALRLGEAYMDGRLTVEDGTTLHDLLAVMVGNLDRLQGSGIPHVLFQFRRQMRRFQQYNPVGRARANVAHHYDLSNEFYSWFLDADMQYSCAYYRSPEESLEQAQANKKAHIAAKLALKPGQRVLDIGSGWGGLGLALARSCDVTVRGLTLSTEQHALATQRACDSQLADRVRFELSDYRQETETFDRIVSVGMFEHVGSQHYQEFFQRIGGLLADDGIALVHSIGRMEEPGSTNAWLRKYIFPGGYTPALSEVMHAAERAGLWVTDLEILRQHYAFTLRHWYDRVQGQRDRIVARYDERFLRMWEFYLAGCELSFRLGRQMVFQLQLTKSQDALPLTRDYIYEWERTCAPTFHQAA